MEEVKEDILPNPHYCIPHQAVLRHDKSTTKLRVVFNAPAKTSNGISLKYTLVKGRTDQNELWFTLLLGFVNTSLHFQLMLKRCTGRFLQKLQKRNVKDIILTSRELNHARDALVRQAQTQEFNAELKALSLGNNIQPQTSKDLRKLHNLVMQPDEKVSSFLSTEGVYWKFIPPKSPNFGGIWEAGVKSFKFHAKRIIDKLALTIEEFLTITVQIEGILNSRLIPLSAEVENFEVLTPGHFLIGSAQREAIVEPDLYSVNTNKHDKYRKITKIVQIIWKSCKKDYLNNLQARSKWQFDQSNVKINTVVLLREDNLLSHSSLDHRKNCSNVPSCQVIYSQFGLAIHQNDHQARRRFVEWAQNEIAVVPDFHKRILFSDEAHFWLNGYVNKQNCRIWSEANPQVYVETPLHPEKLTVWCALWAGGILLQKR
ncbi:reverse transcriptase domain-containing protein [Trichonephila clavipes]|nr:reverse transcriptase domain-containing protein [Trichonephila clavipes]